MAETALLETIKKLGLEYDVDHGGGAFYGPKIDIKIEDALGREWQCSTIQFDFNLPERFDMSYVNSEGKEQRPFMIHRALLGSLERFMGVMIEHHAGKFPIWLSPEQVRIITVNPKYDNYGKDIEKQLKSQNIRVEMDYSDEKLGYKIRKASKEKCPFIFVIGEKEVETKTVSIRQLDKGDLGQKTIQEFIMMFEELQKKA